MYGTCIYTYIYIERVCVCVCVYVCIYMYVFMYIYICTHTHTHTHTHQPKLHLMMSALKHSVPIGTKFSKIQIKFKKTLYSDFAY